MTQRKRRVFSAEFKARVALEAARGVRTVNEIAAEKEVHPVQVSQWKKEVLEVAAALFERGNAKARKAEEQAELERAAVHLRAPAFGSRQMVRVLRREHGQRGSTARGGL